MLAMITSSLQISVAIFALIMLHISALDALTVAVYEHAVILPNKTETLVSQDNAPFLMNENTAECSNDCDSRRCALWMEIFQRNHFSLSEGYPGPSGELDYMSKHPETWSHTNTSKTHRPGQEQFYVLANIGNKKSCSSYDSTCPPEGGPGGTLPTETPVSKEEALLLMNKNIDVLENAVKLAARQGAHIIVTPEDGIYGWVFTRETIYPYLEDIPDPEVNWIPCTDPQRFGYTPVQQRLSCLAKDNSIYVVANIGDKKPCNASDPQCPPDGRYQYNTDVVFDSEGRLVARYHKYNLFAPEIQFDFPKDSESVTFETPFGKFGIFTCFDIFSHTPAVVVVDEFQVDSVLYPVAWYNTLPLLSAVPFHSAWARAMRVNLLAANTHNTSMHMTGSGIYAPEAVKVYHYDMETESGQLMLSELKSRPRSEPTYPAAVDWSAYARSVKPFLSEQSNFPGMIYFDELTFIELKRNTGNYTVCQKDLCCHLTYKMSEKRTDEVYALGAFDGLHTVEGQYYLQICTLLKCQISDLRTCGEPVGSAFTKLEEFSLSGTFATRYVFPQIILSGSQLAPERHYEVLRDGRLRSRSRTPLPVLVLALYGRVFDKDPPRLGQGPRRFE